MFSKNSLSASWPVLELSSPRLDWPQVGMSESCPVSIAASACAQMIKQTRMKEHSFNCLSITYMRSDIFILTISSSEKKINWTPKKRTEITICDAPTKLINWPLLTWNRNTRSGITSTSNIFCFDTKRLKMRPTKNLRHAIFVYNFAKNIQFIGCDAHCGDVLIIYFSKRLNNLTYVVCQTHTIRKKITIH